MWDDCVVDWLFKEARKDEGGLVTFWWSLRVPTNNNHISWMSVAFLNDEFTRLSLGPCGFEKYERVMYEICIHI